MSRVYTDESQTCNSSSFCPLNALYDTEKLPLLVQVCGVFFPARSNNFKYSAYWETWGLRANSITQWSVMIEVLSSEMCILNLLMWKSEYLIQNGTSESENFSNGWATRSWRWLDRTQQDQHFTPSPLVALSVHWVWKSKLKEKALSVLLTSLGYIEVWL